MFFLLQSKGDKGEGLPLVSAQMLSVLLKTLFDLMFLVTAFCLLVFYFLPSDSPCTHSVLIQKRKSSSLLDARMAKIYRRQRHSRDGDDSASDDDEG